MRLELGQMKDHENARSLNGASLNELAGYLSNGRIAVG